MELQRYLQAPEGIVAGLSASSLKARHFRVAMALLACLYRWPERRRELAVSYLATATGLSRRTVADALREMMAAGVLERIPGAGSRPDAWAFRAPELWSCRCVSDRRRGDASAGSRPAQGGHDGELATGAGGTRPSPRDRHGPDAIGAGSPPLVTGTGGTLATPLRRDKVREREERESIRAAGAPAESRDAEFREHAAHAFARYPHPTTGVVRQPGGLDHRRRDEILQNEARGSWGLFLRIVDDAVDGYVARKGLAPHPSGWDPWEHFELASILSSAKLAENVAAAMAARELGHVPPLRRGDHARHSRRPTTRADDQQRERARERAELEAQVAAEQRERETRTPGEALAATLSALEALPDGEFKRERMRRVRNRAKQQAATR